jgi:GT2 family glycosyltransferase
MDVAVVIVTVGKKEELQRCVEALRAGTRLPRELVVIEQGGRVEERDLASWLAGTEVRVRCLRVAPEGVSHARNLGAAAAASPLLCFTDDDCVPDTGWLAALVAAVESGADAASGRVLPLPTEDPRRVPVSSRTSTAARRFGPDDRARPWEAGTGGNLLVRRDRFRALGGFDERFGPGAAFRAAEDVELLDRLLADGATVVYEPAALVFHETKTRAERLGRRYPYGYGMGALVATREPGRRLPLARAYAGLQARALARALRHGAARGALEPFLALAGFAAGARAGRAQRSRRRA